jgi:superfamily II DNA or RNA helicase
MLLNLLCCVPLLQMLGRGLRIMPGKQDCLVLDFTDKYHQVCGSSEH